MGGEPAPPDSACRPNRQLSAEFLSDMRLILASTSPRRREILSLLGVPFDVIEPEFDEQVSAHRYRGGSTRFRRR